MDNKTKHLISVRQYASKMLAINKKDFAVYGIHYNNENHIVDSVDKITYWNTDDYRKLIKNTELKYGQQGIAAVVIAVER